jgi:hypothetical protein
VVPVPDGSPVPQGLAVDGASGELRWVPEARQRGEHRFRLRVLSDTDVQDVTVRVYCSQLQTVARVGAGPVGVRSSTFVEG